MKSEVLGVTKWAARVGRGGGGARWLDREEMDLFYSWKIPGRTYERFLEGPMKEGWKDL